MFSPQTNSQNMKNRKLQKTVAKLVMIAAVPAALISQNAIAATDDNASSINITYQDLNLTKKKDQKRLAMRINSAAKKVCNVYQVRTINERISAKQCQNEAMKKAYRQMQSVVAQNQTRVKLANKPIPIVGN